MCTRGVVVYKTASCSSGRLGNPIYRYRLTLVSVTTS